MVKTLRRLLNLEPPRVVFMARPIDEIAMAQYPVLMVPMYGVMVPVVGRELTEAQILACGDFSLIGEILDPGHKATLEEIRDYSRLQMRITEAWLLRPSYAEIMEVVGAGTKIQEARASLMEIERQLFTMPEGPEKAELLLEATALEMFSEYLLPTDFTAAVFAFAVGLDKSDIRKVSDEVLLRAAILAERGHDNPADHVEGRFTAFNRDDINLRAWHLLQKHREQPNAN